MEKLLIKSNGQWELQKARGDPDYDNVEHGNSPFKDDKSAKEAKNNFIDTNANKDHFKKMKNIHTGKEEDHVLLHRGISAEYPEDINPNGEYHSADGSVSKQNLVDFSNNKTVKTSTNSIHTLQREEAEGHAEADYHGKTLSFWVPTSSIHGYSADVNKHHDSKYKDIPADLDHVMIAPGEYGLHSSDTYEEGKKVK